MTTKLSNPTYGISISPALPTLMASMTSKPLQPPTDFPGQPSQSSQPPVVSPSNKVLSSIISLPTNPSIVYAIFVPASDLELPSEEAIELARRLLVSRNKSAETSILNSLLPCVRVHKDSKCLYVFGITSQDQMVESRQRINNMQFDGLICEWSYFLFLYFPPLWHYVRQWCHTSTLVPL